MKQTPDMEKKLERVLESLDGVQRATPSPYFYTRLRARMARERDWGGIAGLIARPVYAIAMVCVVVSINVWIVIRDNRDVTPAGSVTRISTGDVPDEYNVAVNTFYDYETP